MSTQCGHPRQLAEQCITRGPLKVLDPPLSVNPPLVSVGCFLGPRFHILQPFKDPTLDIEGNPVEYRSNKLFTRQRLVWLALGSINNLYKWCLAAKGQKLGAMLCALSLFPCRADEDSDRDVPLAVSDAGDEQAGGRQQLAVQGSRRGLAHWPDYLRCNVISSIIQRDFSESQSKHVKPIYNN